jgi:secreted PhoX family phosphatase
MSNCKGTLYVVRFNGDAKGQWNPMELITPTSPNQASPISAVELANLGNSQQNSLVKLSRRIGIAGSTAIALTKDTIKLLKLDNSL